MCKKKENHSNIWYSLFYLLGIFLCQRLSDFGRTCCLEKWLSHFFSAPTHLTNDIQMLSIFLGTISSIHVVTSPLSLPHSQEHLKEGEKKQCIREINLNHVYFSLDKTFHRFCMILFGEKSSRLKNTALEESSYSSHWKIITENLLIHSTDLCCNPICGWS